MLKADTGCLLIDQSRKSDTYNNYASKRVGYCELFTRCHSCFGPAISFAALSCLWADILRYNEYDDYLHFHLQYIRPAVCFCGLC